MDEVPCDNRDDVTLVAEMEETPEFAVDETEVAIDGTLVLNDDAEGFTALALLRGVVSAALKLENDWLAEEPAIELACEVWVLLVEVVSDDEPEDAPGVLESLTIAVDVEPDVVPLLIDDATFAELAAEVVTKEDAANVKELDVADRPLLGEVDRARLLTATEENVDDGDTSGLPKEDVRRLEPGGEEASATAEEALDDAADPELEVAALSVEESVVFDEACALDEMGVLAEEDPGVLDPAPALL